jgi:tRNA (guanosine-2'-O-)-methyltransferase
MGANKWLTLNYYDNQEEKGIVTCLKNLKRRGYFVIATVPREDAIAIEDLSIEKPAAFIFGTELTGLTQEAIDLADVAVKIPMYGFTESFNISNSVAIILSQFTEKLRKSGKNIALSTEEKEELLFEWLQKAVKSSDLLIDNFIMKKKR